MSQMSQGSYTPGGQSHQSGQMAQQNASGGFTERLADAGEKAANLADEATRKAGNAASSLAQGAEALASDVGQRLKTVGAEAEAVANAAREKASDLEAMLASEVKAHPLRTLAIAAAAGAILGFFAGR